MPAAWSAPSRQAWRSGPAPKARRHLWQAAAQRWHSQVTVSKDRLEEFIRAEMNFFAQKDPRMLKLEQIVHASTPAKVARLVQKELPYRFASRVKHIQSLPGWDRLPELVRLNQIFSDSFRELRLAEPMASEEPHPDELAPYTEVIHSLRRRHQGVVALLAEAIRKMHFEDGFPGGTALQSWADTFLLSRISTEMLTQHYVAIIEASGPSARAAAPGSVGIVDTKCNPGKVCEEAALYVRQRFTTPDVSVRIHVQTNNCSSSQAAIEFSYIPKYLFWIVEELLRNAARSTMEALESGGGHQDPSTRPIRVTVCADQKQVAIRISDKGGGIPFGNASKIWSYQFSTAKPPFDAMDSPSPLVSRGVGLPLSRLLTRYLGGSLELMNMPGIGVDSYLFLSRIATDESVTERSLPTSLTDMSYGL